MKNIINGLKENKGVIIKKALVVVGTLVGMAIVDALRNRPEEYDYDTEEIGESNEYVEVEFSAEESVD